MKFDYHGHELFISHIQDQIRLSDLRHHTVMTSFLTPVEQEIVKTIVPKNVQMNLFGGYDGAQRKVACFVPYEDNERFEISILVSKFDNRFKKISHKDILGALMHLGIERETLGDLIVDENRIVIFCKESIRDFIIMNLTSIGRVRVQFEEVDSIEIHTPTTKEILVHASSTRLDCVVASLAHISRSEATRMIHHGLIKVNDIVLEENRQLCNNDFVSIRKCGRFQYKDVQSTTKKGRYILRFEQFI